MDTYQNVWGIASGSFTMDRSESRFKTQNSSTEKINYKLSTRNNAEEINKNKRKVKKINNKKLKFPTD